MKRIFYSLWFLMPVLLLFTSCQDIGDPTPTEWRYDGKYQFIAKDGSGTKYPEWIVEQTIKTAHGVIKVPSEWKLDKSLRNISMLYRDDFQVMEIGIYSFILSDPYFNAPPSNHCDRILWEQLDNRAGYRIYALTAECDQPAASGDDSITIRKYIYFISNVTGTHEGRQFHYGYYFYFNKAVIYNDEIQYYVSNRTIDEIVRSFTPHGFDSLRPPH